MVIRSIGALSCAKIAGALYAVIGLIVGVCLSLFALLGGFAAGDYSPFFGAAAVVIFPILYGVFGFVMTLIVARLYNVFAGMMGGVEVDVQ